MLFIQSTFDAQYEETVQDSNRSQQKTERMNSLESDYPVFNAAQMLRFVNENG